jgi:hypothetical protein
VRRVCDEPKTPYQRLREAGVLSREQSKQLGARYAALNPAQLRREIERLRERLFDLAESKSGEALPRRRRHGPGIELQRARTRRLAGAAD